jgi:hypothetical protein
MYLVSYTPVKLEEIMATSASSATTNRSHHVRLVVEEFDPKHLGVTPERRITYMKRAPLFSTNPMLCVETPRQRVVKGLVCTTLILRCDSTSSAKTEANRKFFAGIDGFFHASQTSTLPYTPLLRPDGTVKLKVIHNEGTIVVDRNKHPVSHDTIVAGASYCKFLLEPGIHIIKSNERKVGVLIHYEMIKPAPALAQDLAVSDSDKDDDRYSQLESSDDDDDEDDDSESGSDTSGSGTSDDTGSTNTASGTSGSRSVRSGGENRQAPPSRTGTRRGTNASVAKHI